MKVWVNVFLATHHEDPSNPVFRFSKNYDTREEALKGIYARSRYIDTVQVEFGTKKYLTRMEGKHIPIQ